MMRMLREQHLLDVEEEDEYEGSFDQEGSVLSNLRSRASSRTSGTGSVMGHTLSITGIAPSPQMTSSRRSLLTDAGGKQRLDRRASAMAALKSWTFDEDLGSQDEIELLLRFQSAASNNSTGSAAITPMLTKGFSAKGMSGANSSPMVSLTSPRVSLVSLVAESQDNQGTEGKVGDQALFRRVRLDTSKFAEPDQEDELNDFAYGIDPSLLKRPSTSNGGLDPVQGRREGSMGKFSDPLDEQSPLLNFGSLPGQRSPSSRSLLGGAMSPMGSMRRSHPGSPHNSAGSAGSYSPLKNTMGSESARMRPLAEPDGEQAEPGRITARRMSSTAPTPTLTASKELPRSPMMKQRSSVAPSPLFAAANESPGSPVLRRKPSRSIGEMAIESPMMGRRSSVAPSPVHSAKGKNNSRLGKVDESGAKIGGGKSATRKKKDHLVRLPNRGGAMHAP